MKVEGQHLLKNLCFELPQLDATYITTDRIHHSAELAMFSQNLINELAYGNLICHIDEISFEQLSLRSCRLLQGGILFLMPKRNHYLCIFLKKR